MLDLLSHKNKHNSMFVLTLCSLCFYYNQTVKIHITNHKNAFPILNFQKIIFVHTITFCISYTLVPVLCLSGQSIRAEWKG